MQVSIKWLKDYIDFTETPEELADKLTMAGIPVENVIRADAGLDKVVTGKIEKIVKHPDSDHLNICTMNVGEKENIIIITGAQNVREGQVVPVAMIGANLPCGKKISKGRLRGIDSFGMLCSPDELELDTSAMTPEQLDGIYILPADTPVGVPAKEVLGKDDVILEFELTANRGDCFSVLGLIREISVLTGNKPKFPEIKVQEEAKKTAEMIDIDIEAKDLCSRFSARVLENVKIGPSPEWMKVRLQGAGIRAVNNVVDVTNFVMLELGQPMHAYDYDQIAGHKLTARCAAAGEELHTLDDSSRKAKGGELVIADGEKAAGLAGVMGGLETEVTENTQTVVLEAASFNGPSIRRTARGCGLHSEASGRFERGVDVTQTIRALNRAAQLLQEMGACTVCEGFVDVYPEPKAQVKVAYNPQDINKRLGINMPAEEMTQIFVKLGFEITKFADDKYEATVPTWRNDVSVMADLSEEIARIHGFEGIEASTPLGNVVQGCQSAQADFVDEIKAALTGMGMDEAISFAFMHPSAFEKMHVPADSMLRQAVPIMNPLTDEYPLVRTTLLAGLFDNLVRNLSRKNEDVRLFEIAPVFYPKALPVTEQPKEVLKLAGIMTGHRQPLGWTNDGTMLDFYDLKGMVEKLFSILDIKGYMVEAGEHFAMHPGKTAFFKKGKDVFAVIGEVHPAVAEAYGLSKKAFIFEMDIDAMRKYSAKKVKYNALPKYPAISRDLAILVDAKINEADIERVITKNGGKYLESVKLFDVYTGKQVGAGKKSLAFSMFFRSPSETLQDEVADKAFTKIVGALAANFEAELRA